MAQTAPELELPELRIEEWEPTLDTLHLWTQIVGKVRLATATPRNHWWHAPLYVDVRGLTTRRMHHGGRTFQIDFDFVDHRLVVRTARGDVEWFELADGLSVAEFDSSLHQVLDGLGVDAAVREIPYGLPMTTPFPEEGWSSRRTNRRTPRAPNRSNRGHARNARLRPSRWSIFSGTASTLR